MSIAPGPFMWGPPGLFGSSCRAVRHGGDHVDALEHEHLRRVRGHRRRMRPRTSGVSGVSAAPSRRRSASSPARPSTGEELGGDRAVGREHADEALAPATPPSLPNAVAELQMGLVSATVSAPRPPSRRRRLNSVRWSIGASVSRVARSWCLRLERAAVEEGVALDERLRQRVAGRRRPRGRSSSCSSSSSCRAPARSGSSCSGTTAAPTHSRPSRSPRASLASCGDAVERAVDVGGRVSVAARVDGLAAVHRAVARRCRRSSRSRSRWDP